LQGVAFSIQQPGLTTFFLWSVVQHDTGERSSVRFFRPYLGKGQGTMSQQLEIEATECVAAQVQLVPSVAWCTCDPLYHRCIVSAVTEAFHLSSGSVRRRFQRLQMIRPMCLACSVIKIMLQFCKEHSMHKAFDAIQARRVACLHYIISARESGASFVV
jgi:LisH-like dimerisation domain